MLPRTIGITLLLLGFCVFVVSPTFGADTEKPSQKIIEHYKWCSASKSQSETLARFEGFWSRYAPRGEREYEDAIHVRFVHLCAYRLAELYADTGNSKKCREMLTWLEKEDYFVK
jgi:hypothetical protein